MYHQTMAILDPWFLILDITILKFLLFVILLLFKFFYLSLHYFFQFPFFRDEFASVFLFPLSSVENKTNINTYDTGFSDGSKSCCSFCTYKMKISLLIPLKPISSFTLVLLLVLQLSLQFSLSNLDLMLWILLMLSDSTLYQSNDDVINPFFWMENIVIPTRLIQLTNTRIISGAAFCHFGSGTAQVVFW